LYDIENLGDGPLIVFSGLSAPDLPSCTILNKLEQGKHFGNYSAAERRMNVGRSFKAGWAEPPHPSRRGATRCNDALSDAGRKRPAYHQPSLRDEKGWV